MRTLSSHFQRLSIALAVAVTTGAASLSARAEPPRDIVVYGATSGGIIAAIQARRMGKSVVVIEPSGHVGGLTTGGLGATDIGNKAAIGGLAREFYRRIGRHYSRPEAWRQERMEDYQSRRKVPGEEEMWTFEPHVAANVYRDWIAEAGVEVIVGERLDRVGGGARLDGHRIRALRTVSGREFPGTVFIDATYEGDLMAAAGVSYHVGREANAVYGETLNGIQVARATKHQFTHDVDPYVVPGDPTSGLVALVDPEPAGTDGAGDARVQAYCFRMCTTDAPDNRRPWPKPAGYDEKTFEMLFRNFEAGDRRIPWNPVFMPNRKTDTNNNFAISTDYLGANHAYPTADDATRARIVADHRAYQQGLMWSLANHPRVPAEVREQFQRLGLARDEFTDNDNWPHQIYVREARRMVSEMVMNQNHCQQRLVADDPVGLGAYNMDSHNVRRTVTADGTVRNEGDIQVGVSPYRIAYRSIRPRKEECENLLVPVCLAASHIAYGSIRMEPVFMVLGQSAATAAALAIDAGTAVQDVPYPALAERLRADGQVLDWTGPARKPQLEAAQLAGVVVDTPAAELEGDWSTSHSIGGFVGDDYLHDGGEGKGRKRARFTPDLPAAGRYEIRYFYTAASNRSRAVPVRIESPAGTTTVTLDQREKPPETGFVLGRFVLPAGKATSVVVDTAGTTDHVIIDAVQFIPVAAE
ncbi:MAG: FAD-dependent oxidoreductase [Planctomycetes bacterium]|nr:FAD-dependent oxidoreductase [Planctomycetota bacterium]